jgi:hypothetical protein
MNNNRVVWMFAAMVVVGSVAPFVVYPTFLMKLLCFALFACAFNLLLGFSGLLSFGHAAFFGGSAYITGYLCRDLGLTPELGVIAGGVFSGLLGGLFGWIAIRRAGHLLRHDHPGPGPAGVLSGHADDVHRRRRRHAGHPARHAAGRVRPVRQHRHVLLRVCRVHGGLLAGVPHHPFALWPDFEGHPRQRGPRHFPGLRRGQVQAAGFRHFGGIGRHGGFHQSAGVPAWPRWATCTGTPRVRWC